MSSNSNKITAYMVWIFYFALSLTVMSGFVFADLALAQQKTKEIDAKLEKIVSDVNKKDDKKDPIVGDDAVKIFLDKIEVFGHIDRPQAVYIVPGSDPRIDDIGIDRSFFKEIFRPLERSRLRKSLSRYSRDYIPW